MVSIAPLIGGICCQTGDCIRLAHLNGAQWDARRINLQLFSMEKIMAKIADHKAFDVEFANAVQSIGASEKITKDLLKVYASLAVQAVHQFQNPDYLNRLRVVLTPVNMRAFTQFAIHFSVLS